MFAPKVPKAQTKAIEKSSSKMPQQSTILGHRLGHHPVEQALFLQRTIGNQATLRLLAQQTSRQQGSATENTMTGETSRGASWDFSKIPLFPPKRQGSSPQPSIIQRKLVVGQINDPLEHEADRVADQVMRMSAPVIEPAASPPQVSRKCTDCEEEEKLQKKPAQSQTRVGEAPAIVQEALRSPGRPLDAATRAFMEPRFGHDFSKVRVHTDATAAESAKVVGARAYTVGSNVVFGAGEFAPGSSAGQRLLGHELAHVVQQSKGLFGQQLQRDMIPFGKLTWSNFNGAPPSIDPKNQQASDQWGAETASFIDQIPSYYPKISAEPVKHAKKCGKGDTMFQATAVPDDDSYKGIVAKMDTDKSWARPLYKTGDATDYCNQKVSVCENWFQQNKGSLRFSPKFPIDPVDITKKEDCQKLILPRCTKVWAPRERERLLKHEQYHFNLTNVIANNMKQDLDVRAKAFSAAGSACGNDASHDAARSDYLAKVKAALGDPAQAWLDARSKAQGEYDRETDHGGDFAAQKTWEAKIDGGVKGYGPAPVANATATSPSSPAPTTTPPPTAPVPQK